MYNYQKEREKLFTDKGQRLFLKVRDSIACKIKVTGAITIEKAINDIGGDSWELLACVDRLKELGELRGLLPQGPSQNRILIPKGY